ncbi:SDR family oxidoreductase [Actinocatenispora thailandica]
MIGGTGLIGSKVVSRLGEQGHEAVAAAPNTGVNTLTGEGLAEALDGADVVVDVSNSPSFDDDPAMRFFRTATTNLLQQAEKANVKHYVALSVVGTDQLLDSGYFRAKQAQEDMIAGSGLPYSIVHATQFFEFIRGIADFSTVDGEVHLPPVLFRPMAAEDVAAGVARVATGAPLNAIREVAGPEQSRLDEMVRTALAGIGDPRPVVTDPQAPYFGVQVGEETLVPGTDAELGTLTYAEWAAQQR